VLGQPFKNYKSKTNEICVAVYQRGIQCLEQATGKLTATIIQKITSAPEIDSQNLLLENNRFEVMSFRFPLQGNQAHQHDYLNWQKSLQDENVILQKRKPFAGLMQSIQNEVFVTGEHRELYSLNRDNGTINYAVGLPSNMKNFKPFYWSQTAQKSQTSSSNQSFLILFDNKKLVLGSF
jgi:hypothetical protein